MIGVRLIRLLVLLMLALPLGACGKKSPPEPPTDAGRSFPAQYPRR